MTENKRFMIKKEGFKKYAVSDKLNQFALPITNKTSCEAIAFALNEIYEENLELKRSNAENSFMIDCFADEEVRLITENEAQKDTLNAIRVNIETVDKENTEDLKTTIELIETILQTRGAL